MMRLIGGEMLLWSDLDATHGPAPAGGASVRPLLGAVSGRTLVAGPHDLALLDALAAEQVTLLVRGAADAEALADRFEVLCGSLEKVAAVPAYDTIVALDGLHRLISAEADDRSWDETLALLTALLRPGGRLLLGGENRFGLHRLIALPPEHADTDFVLPSGPTGLGRLRRHLEAAGLTVLRDYAAYPSALLGREIMADDDLAGFVSAALTAGAAPATDVLADPARLAVGALHSGLAAELAPAWVVMAAKGGTGAGPWPDAIVVRDGRAQEIRLPGDLPRGRTLMDLLLAAVWRRDLPALRELLIAWLAGPAAGVPADQVVVGEAGSHTALAGAVAPLVAVRGFAREVIRGGYADLWPAPADEAGLTALLAGMTGREVEPSDVPAGPPQPAGESVRELRADRDRLARELAEARAKHDWYEETLGNREAELKRVQQVNKLLKATVPGRAATTLYGGLRAGKRAVRKVVKRDRD